MVTDHRHGSSQSVRDRAIRSASINFTQATATPVAAPGVGKKIILLGVSVSDTASIANYVSFSGGTGTILVAMGPGGDAMWEGEYPLSENTALSLTASDTLVGSLQYVVVPA